MFLKTLILLLGISQIHSASFGKLTPLTPSEQYTHSAVIDEDLPDQYVVYWKNNNDEIQIEVHCRTTGWVGFGLSPNGGMPGADIVISWVEDASGRAHVRDTYATAFSRPISDTIQDWVLIDAAQIAGYTIVKMKRKLNTCDKLHDMVIQEETNYLIVAWNNADPVTGNDDWQYHGPNRRIKVEYLLLFKNETLSEEDADIAGAEIVEFTLDRLPIKQQRTFYYCQLVEQPQFPVDVHVLRYDILADKQNKDILHHIVIYECPSNLNVNTGMQMGVECGASAVPSHIAQCISGPIMMAWGIGGNKNYTYPKNTGLPLYKSSTKKYYLFEYHFDNPRLDAGRFDSSGVRFYMTTKLRQYELGVLTLGTDITFIDITIPPQIEGLKLTSNCYAECSNKFIPTQGITVFSGFMHTHLAGRSVRTRLVRNNQVVKYLFNNPKYDFNYQFNIEIEPIKLQRGDALVTDCSYDSKDRNLVTYWGHSTMDEMCFNFVYYYPKIHNYDKCFSKPTPKALFDFYRELSRDGLIPPIVINELNYWASINIIKNALEQTTFTDEIRKRFIDFYANPGREYAGCGSYFYQQDLIYNLEKPFLNPIDLVPPNQCPAH